MEVYSHFQILIEPSISHHVDRHRFSVLVVVETESWKFNYWLKHHLITASGIHDHLATPSFNFISGHSIEKLFK